MEHMSQKKKAEHEKQELAKRMAEREYLAAAKRRFRVQVGNTKDLKEAQSLVSKATTKMRRAFGSDADSAMLDLSRRAMHESREVAA